MARRKKKRQTKTIPILPLAGIAAGVAEPVKRMVSGDIEGGLIELVQRTTGVSIVDGSFHSEWLQSFWMPVIISELGHRVANMLGINRRLANLPSPLNKLRL